MKVKMLLLITAACFLFVLFQSVTFAKYGSKNRESEHYNIIVLLDLSNRIDPEKNPTQVWKDKTILREIVSIFEQLVRKKLYLRSQDRLIITVAPQRTDYNKQLTRLISKLKIDLYKQENRIGGKPKFERTKKELLENIDILYQNAVSSDSYPGADIWLFFRDYLENYIIKSKDVHFNNVLIIITDGYIDFDPKIQSKRPEGTYMDMNHYKPLKRVKGDFGNLRVLVIEINFRQSEDKAIVEKYWREWLSSMNITEVKLKVSLDPEIVASIIRKFIIDDSSTNQTTSGDL